MQIDTSLLESSLKGKSCLAPRKHIAPVSPAVLSCIEEESGLLNSPYPRYPWDEAITPHAVIDGLPPRMQCLRHNNRFVGMSNVDTGIKEAAFWNYDISSGGSYFRHTASTECRSSTMSGLMRMGHDGYIVTGSDCGHALIFDRRTAVLSCALKADRHILNCVRPHPTLPLLATSGIENVIRLWAPRYTTASLEQSEFPPILPLCGPSAPLHMAARATLNPTQISRIITRNCVTRYDGCDGGDSDSDSSEMEEEART